MSSKAPLPGPVPAYGGREQDLEGFRCRGFGEGFDRAMADVAVRGIDREQTLSMIRLCAQTEGVLYGAGFSPRRIRYRRGARVELERVVEGFAGDRVMEAMRWTQ